MITLAPDAKVDIVFGKPNTLPVDAAGKLRTTTTRDSR